MRAALAVIALLVPLAVSAQDAPPSGMVEVELARSRSCVAALGRLEALDAQVQPFAVRMERLRALGRAVSLEDRDEAGALIATDSVEAAVEAWFAADSALAARYVAERDEAVQEERAQARTAILERIRVTMQEVGTAAQERLEGAAAVEAEAEPCRGAIFVRSAVLEACAAGSGGTLCQAAADTAQGPFRFVGTPEELWNVEDYRPWTRPAPLQGTPQGALVGARTASQARLGNIVVAVALAPLIRGRDEITEQEVLDFQANLDSLGFNFDHPLFVMAPALEVEVSVPPPMEGETHVILHFGDLSGDGDMIWSAEVGDGGVMNAVIPASGLDLSRLQAGELVSFTALRMPADEGGEAEPVYTLSILAVNQTQSVSALLQYMGGGDLGRDLAALIPPPAGG